MTKEYETIKSLFGELVRQPLFKFPDYGEKLPAPNSQGVYVIYSPREKPLHVGRTYRAKKGLAQRLRNHMSTKSSFTKKYLDSDGGQLRGHYKFRILEVKNARIRALLEAYAIGRLCPAHLGVSEFANREC